MWNLILKQVAKRLFPRTPFESLSRGQLQRIISEATQIMNRTKGQTAEIKDLPRGIRSVPTEQTIEQPVRRGEIFEVLDDDAFKKLKGEYFRRLITNTDDAVKAFGKRVIEKKQDRRLDRLTKDQRKDFLNMVDDRLKMGNEKFMEKYDATFPPPDYSLSFDADFASGGLARVGMFGGRLVTEGIKSALKRTHKAYDAPGAAFQALMDNPSYLMSPVNMQKIKKLELYRRQLVRDILRKEGGGKFTHGPKPEATRADLKLLDEYIAKLKNKIKEVGYYGEGAAKEKALLASRPDLPFSKFVKDKSRHAQGGLARILEV